MNRLLFSCQWLFYSALLIAGIICSANYLKGYSNLNVLTGIIEYFVGIILLEIIVLIDVLMDKEQKKR